MLYYSGLIVKWKPKSIYFVRNVAASLITFLVKLLNFIQGISYFYFSKNIFICFNFYFRKCYYLRWKRNEMYWINKQFHKYRLLRAILQWSGIPNGHILSKNIRFKFNDLWISPTKNVITNYIHLARKKILTHKPMSKSTFELQDWKGRGGTFWFINRPLCQEFSPLCMQVVWFDLLFSSLGKILSSSMFSFLKTL